MILCCGEALIDMIPTPTETGQEGFTPHSGGAVFNTAIALGRLGVRTGMLTGLSTDMFGAQLEQALHASNVNTSLTIRSDRHTTLAFVRLSDGQATYTFFDENSAGRMLLPGDLPTVPDNVAALYFGGISLACEPGADTYAYLAEQGAAGRMVMLDPNIRPNFIEDVDRYRNRLDRMLSVSDIVKVSDEDLDWIQPGTGDLADKARRLLQAGPSVVIVTKGSEGASAFTSNGLEVSAPSQRATVVDTVGAGDTFNAGVLAKLSELDLLNKDAIRNISANHLQAALTFGARIAAITVSRAGANPPWVDELQT
ncbi:carbohydrate kinase [Aliiroseovarius sp. Z3]|uniref:carbohydrate kinase family protein n=1 Tax=Aliiroseovarius sp. Z3 TaxID=2811402 RepID=UPI0023B261BA|nr:carbohydrate kinase [Aliiroseovarius sp. Z3]MDE9449418.1 carbohydrate kinase [Aliiroseovarius sp. Z3]